MSQVERKGICDTVCDSVAPLALLHAPAGFGKTIAMQQCQERLLRQGVACTWLALEAADNDVSRFLSNIEGAVRAIGIESPQPGSPHDLVRALAACERPFALFLDDFESVHEPVVVELVREFLEHLPRWGRLVIGSRHLPELSLARRRVRGQLLEIGADALRFDADETRSLMDLQGEERLDAQHIIRLHEKTEGWCAALWLASMALRRSDDPAAFVEHFSGSERTVADYLAEDVLARQSDEVRAFLLRTSIVRQLEVSLCAALCPEVDARRLLAQIEADNLFLTRVSAGSQRMRYHSLFADFLRTRLREEQPGASEGLHLAACAWYEAQARPVPAIDHAIEARAWPRVMALLAQFAESLLEQGRMRLLARWYGAIPHEVLRAHPHVHVICIWAICFTRGPWEAEQQIRASTLGRSDDTRVQANLAAMRPQLLAIQDRYQEAYVAGMASLQTVEAGASFARSVLLNCMANIFSVLGNASEAHRQLDGARAASGEDTFNRMYAESMEGLLDLLAGRLRHAKARFRMAVEATHSASFNQTHGNAWAGVLYACVTYEADQIERAEHLLNVYLPMTREVGLPDHMILSHVMRTRIAFAGGDVELALRTLAELEQLGYQRKLSRVVVGARLERARVLLLQGNGPAAKEELQRADIPEIWARERAQRLLAHDLDYLELAQLRWELAFGDAAATFGPLTRALETASLAGRHRRALRVRLLRAMAGAARGDTEAAMADMTLVLRTSAQEGIVRMLLDEGAAAGSLVRQFARAHARVAQGDPILADHLDRLDKAFGPEPTPVAAPDDQEEPLEEPLTQKEIQVLQLLAEGYSNVAMTEKLFVSDSTVRTHLRNINHKLKASSRTHAVALARRRGLIT